MENNEVKRIGIVYSGGFSRGAAQLAFAKQIYDKIGPDRICVITGSSIGAINAYATSCGTMEKLIQIYYGFDADSKGQFANRVRNNLYNDIFNEIEGEMKIPVYVTATAIPSYTCHYFCLNSMPREDLKVAMNSSMSFPFINGPIRFVHKVFTDGGASDNVPVYPLTYFDNLDMIIILHCYPKYYPPIELYQKMPNTIIVDCDVTACLGKNISTYSFTKDSFNLMITKATESGKEFADKVFEDFDKEQVLYRCQEYIKDNLHIRNLKGEDKQMSIVEVMNALYRIKEKL